MCSYKYHGIQRDRDGPEYNILSSALLFSYHCVQLVIEVSIILLAAYSFIWGGKIHYIMFAIHTLYHNPTLFSDSNGQCEYFIPHYLYILLLFNQYAFFTTSCIFTKVTANKYEKSDEQIMEENVIYKRNAIISIGHIWYPLCAWAYTFRTDYYEYLTIPMLLMVTPAMTSQISCLLNLTSGGNHLFFA